MSRRRSGRVKVGTFDNPKLGPAIDLYLNKEADEPGHQFYAEFGDETVQAESIPHLEGKVKTKLGQMRNLKWVPAINLTMMANAVDYAGRPRTFSNEVTKIDATRLYIAFNGSTWVQIDWEFSKETYDSGTREQRAMTPAEIEDYKFKNAQPMYGMPTAPTLAGPHIKRQTSYGGEADLILPYTEARWAAIEALQSGIQRLNEALWKLLSTDSGLLRLEADGPKLLGAGPDKKA